MSKEQQAILNREDRIAACFQAVIALQSKSEEVRRKADVEGLMDFLEDEYNKERGNMRRALNS